MSSHLYQNTHSSAEGKAFAAGVPLWQNNQMQISKMTPFQNQFNDENVNHLNMPNIATYDNARNFGKMRKDSSMQNSEAATFQTQQNQNF